GYKTREAGRLGQPQALAVALSFCRLLGLGCPKQAFAKIATPFPFDAEVTVCYGEIRAQLEAKGTPIGSLDMLIAAHALSLAATLVTNNVREFDWVEGLTIENWIN
uniref:PIN domain-containing protein n=1 Tax=Methyloglobulus sp. TaxID=2518622 RepID=UPI00398998F4